MLGYNRMTGYNVARYNGDGFELTAAESILSTDATVVKSSQKTIVDIVTISETIAKQQNKSVNETVELDIWLRIKKDQAGLWSD